GHGEPVRASRREGRVPGPPRRERPRAGAGGGPGQADGLVRTEGGRPARTASGPTAEGDRADREALEGHGRPDAGLPGGTPVGSGIPEGAARDAGPVGDRKEVSRPRRSTSTKPGGRCGGMLAGPRTPCDGMKVRVTG